MQTQPKNHINYPDNQGRIFCRRLNKIITLDADGKFWDICLQCRMFQGDYQGQGVECLYDDVENAPGYISNPVKEQLRVSKLIDAGTLRSEA